MLFIHSFNFCWAQNLSAYNMIIQGVQFLVEVDKWEKQSLQYPVVIAKVGRNTEAGTRPGLPGSGKVAKRECAWAEGGGSDRQSTSYITLK